MLINKILVDKKIFNIICNWSTGLDYEGKKFPLPTNVKKWNMNISDTKFFILNLIKLEKLVDNDKLSVENNNDCLICKQKNIGTKKYLFKNFIWFDNLKHYVIKHNISPPEEFIEFVYANVNKNKTSKIKKMVRLTGKIKKINDIYFVKLKANQLQILDALMEHGGYSKKYISSSSVKYSEHAGVMDFHRSGLDRIIVSGNTTRIDRGDEEIFLPNDLKNIHEYEYLFHTHPPTSKAGGRANEGVLYEFPSSGDIFHFIDKNKLGSAIGSIIMTPEGLYNIRCNDYTTKNNMSTQDESKLYKEFTNTSWNNNIAAINKYGTTFSKEIYYKQIAQDETYIDNINNVLDKYNLHIDYFPRKKNEYNVWIVSDIYLPLSNQN